MNSKIKVNCLLLLGTAVLGFSLLGCSTSKDLVSSEGRGSIALSGIASINRIAPSISLPSSLFGFLPEANKNQSWLEIDSKTKQLIFYENGSLKEKVPLEGDFQLSPGKYLIKHKQRSALWYAGDDYFLARNLSVPSVGNRERYRRGALGDFTLFLDEEIPIHSSPVWTPEVGGLKLDDEKMKKIYYSLEVGSVVEVR
jgi:hypothetical protein